MKENFPKIRIIVTAGATIEPIDPVRCITNRSTGIMGHEIARECLRRGAEVFLVSGPSSPVPPPGAEVFGVETAEDMGNAVEKLIPQADCLIMAAAVSDFRAKERAGRKIKKTDTLTLELVKTRDILKGLKSEKRVIKVGFALETENAEENGEKKLEEKGLDLIVVNELGEDKSPFGNTAAHDYTLIDSSKDREYHRGITKKELAEIILEKVSRIHDGKNRKKQ